MANVIFDFDGTLADTFPLIVDVAYKLSPQTKRRSIAEIERLRQMPLLNSFLHLGIPLVGMPRLIRNTRKKLAASIGQVPPFAGVPEMFKSLHAAGHKLFILSSNYPENIRSFLKYNKLEHYITDVRGVSWGNTPIKSLALRRLADKYNLEPSESYHVGNEGLDMRAARWAGMRGIGVTWSGYDRARLARSKPFATIATPAELPKLLQ